ncbi:MAG: hypothetical protein U0457_09700 [Candidatus Sericytochromatia bacterium]
MSRLLNDLYNLNNKNSKAVSFYNLALTSMEQKNYENAIISFNKSLAEDNSESIKVLIKPNLAQSYIMVNKFEEAVKELTEALEITKDEQGKAYIHANLGFVYSQLKNYGFSMMEYKKALKITPNNAQYHYALAMLYEAKFQSNLAEAEIDKAIKLAPNNEEYIQAKANLSNIPALSLKIGRTAVPIQSLGIIIAPSYMATEKTFFPMILYIYPESPIKKLAKEGDYIFDADCIKDGIGLIDSLNLAPNTKITLLINNTRVVVNTINPVSKKLNDQEKIKLYRSWFYGFDKKIPEIWEIKDEKEKNDVGTKWGYEFESLIRSWSAYKDPLFESAFILLMEFFQAYVYPDKPDEVHYEINLAKLNFKIINNQIIDFFEDIGFLSTAKYLELKIKQDDDPNVASKSKLAKKPIITKPVKKN